MPHRQELRELLKQAWSATVQGPYRHQEINSERGLQVHFCATLLPLLSKRPRRLFIEPRVVVSSRDTSVFPDILICSERAVIAVVELKYTPRAKPSIDGDLSKLRAFGASEEIIKVANERFRGKRGAPVKYTLAKSAFLCWAGIYCGTEVQVNLGARSKLNGRLLLLHARTAEGKHAEPTFSGAC